MWLVCNIKSRALLSLAVKCMSLCENVVSTSPVAHAGLASICCCCSYFPFHLYLCKFILVLLLLFLDLFAWQLSGRREISGGMFRSKE